MLVQNSLFTWWFEAEILKVVGPDANKKINRKWKASTIWMGYLENEISFYLSTIFFASFYWGNQDIPKVLWCRALQIWVTMFIPLTQTHAWHEDLVMPLTWIITVPGGKDWHSRKGMRRKWVWVGIGWEGGVGGWEVRGSLMEGKGKRKFMPGDAAVKLTCSALAAWVRWFRSQVQTQHSLAHHAVVGRDASPWPNLVLINFRYWGVNQRFYYQPDHPSAPLPPPICSPISKSSQGCKNLIMKRGEWRQEILQTLLCFQMPL